MVDKLVLNTVPGSEFAAGIKWMDEQAKEKGISFYEEAYIVFTKHMANKLAQQWNESK